MDLHQQPTIFHRFWWIPVSVVVLLLAVVFLLPPILKDMHGPKSAEEEEKALLDPRIVATLKTPSGAAFKYGSPTLVGQYLYLGTAQKLRTDGDHQAEYNAIPDNFFYKLDLNLQPVWSYALGKRVVIGAAALDQQGNVYFVACTYTLNANPTDKYDVFLTTLHLVSLTNDGQLRWEQPITDTDQPNDHTMIGVAIGADNTIYVGGKKFYAFDTAGKEQWHYPTNADTIHQGNGSPIIDRQGNVYFVAPEPNAKTGLQGQTDTIRAYKFRPTGGTPIWSTVIGNDIMNNEAGSGGGGVRARSVDSTPAFGLNQTTLIAVTGATISKLDTATGKLLWSTKPKNATGHFAASPVIDEQDNIYIGTKSNYEGTLFSIDAKGQLRWSRLLGADLYDTPMLADDRTVYIGSETTDNGKFWAVNMDTGEVRWSFGKGKEKAVLSDFSMASGLIHDGYIYIGIHEALNNGEILPGLFKIRIDGQNYIPGAAWPRFHGSNENTGR